MKCSNHPDAPHGFNRSASHTDGRYVCDCEGWIPDDEENKMNHTETINKAIEVLQKDGKTIERLQSQVINLKAAAIVLLDTIKRGDDPAAAMYQLEELI